MKVKWFEYGQNYLLHHEGLRVSFNTTEYYAGSLYLFSDDSTKARACLEEGSEALEEFERLFKEVETIALAEDPIDKLRKRI